MKGKRFIGAIITIALLATIIAIPLTACQGGGFGFATSTGKASLSNATMCQSVDLETGEPIEPSDTFTSDTPWIFCSVKLSNAPSGTEVSAEWLYIKQEAKGETSYLVADWSTTTEGTYYIPLSIARPANEWPRGDYKIVLYLNEKETLNVPFKVQ